MKRTSFLKNIDIVAPAVVLLLLLAGCKKETSELPQLRTCQPVTTQGHLTYDATADKYTYRTTGGGTVIIDLGGYISIKHDAYAGFEIALWGSTSTITSANHESLNGTRIKDRIGVRRTIIFPDGAKITLLAESKVGPIISISIYDGAESHYINATCQTLEYSNTKESVTKLLDNAEADGEAGAFEFTSTGLLFVNLYQEDTPGNKVMNRVPLGEIFTDQPGRVVDYYTD